MKLITTIHKNGPEVWIYSINGSKIYNHLKDWGVDAAVFTNYPKLFLNDN